MLRALGWLASLAAIAYVGLFAYAGWVLYRMPSYSVPGIPARRVVPSVLEVARHAQPVIKDQSDAKPAPHDELSDEDAKMAREQEFVAKLQEYNQQWGDLHYANAPDSMSDADIKKLGNACVRECEDAIDDREPVYRAGITENGRCGCQVMYDISLVSPPPIPIIDVKEFRTYVDEMLRIEYPDQDGLTAVDSD